MKRVKVNIKLTNDNASIPTYATPKSSGCDLLCAEYEPIELLPGQWHLFSTGVKVAPIDGYETQVRSRSGLAANHGVVVLQGIGTIDNDYTGEILVPLVNHGVKSYTVKPGDKIAQLVVCPIVQATFTQVDELSVTVRGAGSFGHTGS